MAHFTQLADDIAGEHDSPSFPVGTLCSVQSTVEFGRLSRNQTLTRGLEGPYAILYTNSPLNVVYKASLALVSVASAVLGTDLRHARFVGTAAGVALPVSKASHRSMTR